MTDNEKVFEQGRKKMRQAVDAYLVDRVTDMGVKLIEDGVVSAQYHNLTGNTLTSLAAGIYHRGKLSRIITALETKNLDSATRPKLSKGDGIGVVMVSDYDSGRLVPVRKYKLLDTNEEYGISTSLNFLRTYRSPNDSIGLVMCTGTEYSSYLESKRGLNVLSDTYDYAESIARMSFKPMK